MATIKVDFSKLPSDAAFFLAHQEHTAALGGHLANSIGLQEPERTCLRDELVGTVAKLVDQHLDYATRPQA
jgi:hypothetical protein